MKKLVMLGLGMFLLLSMLAPILAAPTDGQKIEVTQINGAAITTPTVCIRDGITYPYTGTLWVAPGAPTTTPSPGQEHVIGQRRDYGMAMGTTLVIQYSTGDVTLEGKSFNNYDRMFRYVEPYPNTLGAMMVVRYDAIWEFQPQIGLTEYGGFEGKLNMVIKDYTPATTGPPPTPATYQCTFNCVLQGFGAFEGQTIQFKYDGISGQQWKGYLLKP
jgi:hypothetical protein